jgi:uncharacterized membrane protein YebE (DUF533 family)
VSPAERELFLRELASPRPVAELASMVKSPEMAEQFYAVSVLTMAIDTDAERAYLAALPGLLELSPDAVASIHQKIGAAAPT